MQNNPGHTPKAGAGQTSDGIIAQTDGDVNPSSENYSGSYINVVDQAISSAKTSIKQIPALFKHKNAVFGETNIEIGGGRFELATEYLAERYEELCVRPL